LAGDLVCELENMDAGDEFKISCEEMDENEFLNLPEFEGW
jgi:hypothetical protein